MILFERTVSLAAAFNLIFSSAVLGAPVEDREERLVHVGGTVTLRCWFEDEQEVTWFTLTSGGQRRTILERGNVSLTNDISYKVDQKYRGRASLVPDSNVNTHLQLRDITKEDLLPLYSCYQPRTGLSKKSIKLVDPNARSSASQWTPTAIFFAVTAGLSVICFVGL
ncbi:hypothetical protein GN956_G14705 [Arapaima gigas]